MALFQRLTRSMHPSTFRHAHRPKTSPFPSNFYTPTLHRSRPSPSPLRRLYNTNTTHGRRNQDFTKINTNIIYGIIGINTSIFLIGQYLRAQATQGFPVPFSKFFRNFTLNYDEFFQEKRWWTAITSVFTHMTPMHLLGNMVGTFYLGLMLAKSPGMTPMRLLTLVFGSGIAGSAGWLWFRRQKIQAASSPSSPRPRDRACGQGFSGSLMGVSAVAALRYPTAKMAIWGIIPVPLWLLVSGFAVVDGYLLNDTKSRVAHAGHLGGMAFGVLYFFARLRARR